MSSSSRPIRQSFKNREHEERKGLLSGRASFDTERLKVETEGDDVDDGWSPRSILVTAVCFILLLICGAFARALMISFSNGMHANLLFNGDGLRSNGTHDFKRTVLIVSIDGLRADYLDRGLTPHLLDISKQGLRAKSMKPVFPTLTFPNHWALMTGLYAESHGIVANNFYDPVSGSEFHFDQISSCWNPQWWHGEPMWETVNKAGMITANLMWPGPPKTISGAAPTYFVPWRDKVPLEEKLDQLMEWIDLPLELRPQLIMAYEPSLDQAGHWKGPNSLLVNQTLRYVDSFAKDLHNELVVRNLTDIVDIIFVSDHGMSDTTDTKFIYIDKILDEECFEGIEHIDGHPAMGLRFLPTTNTSYCLGLLLDGADRNPDQFDVYTHDTMPERYHFSHGDRIAPIYAIPKIGHILTMEGEGEAISKGIHGYDNDELAMHAMFVAHGPFSSVVKALHQNSRRRLLSRPNKGWHSTSDDTYVMDRFENVQIYNLVMKLLGIEGAKTNGTVGFWDKYF